jgi:hypothetical protein
MRKQLFILLILALSMSCSNSKTSRPDYIIFDADPLEKDLAFRPSVEQIDQAEAKLMEYLEEKTKDNQTIYISALDGDEPLQDQLKHYKRRYFGRTSIEGDKIIKIQFVFVRCAGGDDWKKPEYANEQTKDCGFSVQYNIDNEQIYDLQL